MFNLFSGRDKKGRFKKGHRPIKKKNDSRYILNKHAVNTEGKSFIKLFGIGDIHYEETETKMINIESTLKFLTYWGPIDFLVFAGDIWDLGFLAHWNSDKFDDVGHIQIAKQLERESKKVKELLKRFIKAARPKKIIYIVGNHEDWLPQYLSKYDKVHSHLGKNKLSQWLDFEELGIEEIPLHQDFTVGHMTLSHGENYGTENPAKRAIERSHRSRFFWHWHKFISWPGYTDADENEKIQAYSVPGFCKAAEMSYMKKAANNWSNGFLLAYIKPSGHFTPHIQVVSPKGHFMYNDKEFE